MTFAFPLALWGLLAIPALLAIYFLIGRAVPRRVSSLFLWVGEQHAPSEGARFRRLDRAWILLLEILLLLLLVFAAARPVVTVRSDAVPLALVLDQSFSMAAAREGRPVRDWAYAGLAEIVEDRRYSSFFFVLAGEKPVLLPPPSDAPSSTDLLATALPQWTCEAAGADLTGALALARQVGGPLAQIVVLTDRPPPSPDVADGVLWAAFGVPQPNAALVNGVRTLDSGRDRCLLEIANLGEVSKEIELTMDGSPPRRQIWSFAAGERKLLRFDIEPGRDVVRFQLAEDALDRDNAVVLARPFERSIGAAVRVDNQARRRLVEAALYASPFARPVRAQPELLITDAPYRFDGAANRPWVLELHTAAKPLAYTGPFVTYTSHPLCEGLGLAGVIWGADTRSLNGLPLITAGDLTLFSEERRSGTPYFHLQYNNDRGNLHQTPNWPILFDNLVRLRASELDGLDAANWRLGSEVVLRTRATGETVTLSGPGGSERAWVVDRDRIELPTPKPGLYQVAGGGVELTFAVNALDQGESDLRRTASGTWGTWRASEERHPDSRELTLPLLLVALSGLLLHGFVLRRRKAEVAW
ncbi:BatA and WFA domain-containing protein [Sulfidibacter corallicola]|uniref:BatA and WFA domain-containing protein n=1 Tax=Sulfidibacter corallicola TaxID=2818388 RepID=A0A8A4TXN0_SULCO|nr:BatA and WFA domain-containing protein [Sulfidibacter corallicola]QTD53732.1 BatA and WFA domain-containing protein [Sulfidibacter corallicola]